MTRAVLLVRLCVVAFVVVAPSIAVAFDSLNRLDTAPVSRNHSEIQRPIRAPARTMFLLPDFRRGLASIEKGDIANAEADLIPLAERGHVEAQVALAKMYSIDLGGDRLAEAAYWYRQALPRDAGVKVPLARTLLLAPDQARPGEVAELIREAQNDKDVRTQRLLLRLYRDFPDLESEELGAAMASRFATSPWLRDRREAIRWYRVRGDDARYADKLGALCERHLQYFPACHADLVRHRRLRGENAESVKFAQDAASLFVKGDLAAGELERAAGYLADDDLPGEPDMATAYSLLEQIEPPLPSTQVRMAKLLARDPSLDPNENPESLLHAALAAGDPDAALFLGRRYMEPTSELVDPLLAEKLLRQAAAQRPAAHFELGRLFERGYHGRAEPVRALAHYLTAARQNYHRADFALANMFSQDRGVRVDLLSAYAFALIAQGNDVEGAAELAATLRAELPAEQIREAYSLRSREQAARHYSPYRAYAADSFVVPSTIAEKTSP